MTVTCIFLKNDVLFKSDLKQVDIFQKQVDIFQDIFHFHRVPRVLKDLSNGVPIEM